MKLHLRNVFVWLSVFVIVPVAVYAQGTPSQPGTSQPSQPPGTSQPAQPVAPAAPPENWCEEPAKLTLSNDLLLPFNIVAWTARGLQPGTHVFPATIDYFEATHYGWTGPTEEVNPRCQASGSFLAGVNQAGTWIIYMAGETPKGEPAVMTAIFTIVEGTIQLPTPTPRETRPRAPSAFRATTINETTIRLDWVDNSDNENGFRIKSSRLGDFTTGPNVTFLNVGGAHLDEIVCFELFAFNDAGDTPGGITCDFVRLTPTPRR